MLYFSPLENLYANGSASDIMYCIGFNMFQMPQNLCLMMRLLEEPLTVLRVIVGTYGFLGELSFFEKVPRGSPKVLPES